MARNELNPYRGGRLTAATSSDPFLSLHREMNRLFDDVLRELGTPGPRRHAGEGGMMMQPEIDVSETDKEIRVCADLPGVSESDVHVELNEDVLTIRGERRQEREENDEDYHLVERAYGTFQRALRLPMHIESEKVQADFDNGVLTVTIPKSEEGRRSRRIQIQGKGPRAQQSALGRAEAAGASAPAPQGRKSEASAKSQQPQGAKGG